MKSTFTILALISLSHAIKFDVAEGPTKADNGENDDQVLGRKDHPSAFANSDSGDGDDTVLMDL